MFYNVLSLIFIAATIVIFFTKDRFTQIKISVVNTLVISFIVYMEIDFLTALIVFICDCTIKISLINNLYNTKTNDAFKSYRNKTLKKVITFTSIAGLVSTFYYINPNLKLEKINFPVNEDIVLGVFIVIFIILNLGKRTRKCK